MPATMQQLRHSFRPRLTLALVALAFVAGCTPHPPQSEHLTPLPEDTPWPELAPSATLTGPDSDAIDTSREQADALAARAAALRARAAAMTAQ